MGTRYSVRLRLTARPRQARARGPQREVSAHGWSRCPGEAGRLLDAVVRSLLGDDHVVDVALLEPRLGDADEARVGAQLAEPRRAAVAHARAHTADQLVDAAAQAAAIRHAPLDALGHQLARVFDV